MRPGCGAAPGGVRVATATATRQKEPSLTSSFHTPRILRASRAVSCQAWRELAWRAQVRGGALHDASWAGTGCVRWRRQLGNLSNRPIERGRAPRGRGAGTHVTTATDHASARRARGPVLTHQPPPLPRATPAHARRSVKARTFCMVGTGTRWGGWRCVVLLAAAAGDPNDVENAVGAAAGCTRRRSARRAQHSTADRIPPAMGLTSHALGLTGHVLGPGAPGGRVRTRSQRDTGWPRACLAAPAQGRDQSRAGLSGEQGYWGSECKRR